MTFRDPFSCDYVSVVISELLVATADSSDPLVDDSVSQVLKMLRERLKMDVVFVSEFFDGKRVFRFATMPFRLGAHLSTPIVLKSGHAYGTLCCFSAAPNPQLREEDLKNLRLCASLVAKKLELAKARGIKEPPANWQLEPMGVYESPVWAAPSRRNGGR